MPTGLHTCMLCEAVCGISVDVEGGEVASVRGDAADPFSGGHICPKAAALRDIHSDPDRVREPLRRVGDRFVPVTWKEALEEAGSRFAEIQKRAGRSALAVYFGNPTVHSYSATLFAPFASKVIGTRSRFSATSVDQLPQMLASQQMFGHQLALPVPDVDRTDFFLMLGANPRVSNGSLMTAGNIGARLDALKARGGKLVVVDPRRSETAQKADQHHAIRPGGDAYLLLGMLQVIFDERLDRLGALQQRVVGMDALRRGVAPFPPERVAGATGLSAATIRALARDFAAAPRAVCYGRVGLCAQRHGGVASWLVVALNAVTGHLDAEGGMMFPKPAVDLIGLASLLGERGHFGVWKSRVRGLPEFGGELPAAVMSEEMETAGDGQLRGLLTFAGNPVLSTPNGVRLERALARLDFMVSIDLYINETTRHAHLILPTSVGLEREHYDAVFYGLAVRNAARFVEPLLQAPPGVLPDWVVLCDLALAIDRHGGGRRDRKAAVALKAARRLGPRRILDLLLRAGPYGLGRGGLSLRALKDTPHGKDLGPLVPRLAALMGKRRLKLVPAPYEAEVARLETELQAAAGVQGTEAGLVLIGRRLLRSNNSWMHNSLRLVKGKDACTLRMHPQDAQARNVGDGSWVTVSSRAGSVTVRAELADEMARGVVSLPHGFGHARAGVALGVASAHAGVSANDLTDERWVDPFSGNAALNGVPVEVAPYPSAN